MGTKARRRLDAAIGDALRAIEHVQQLAVSASESWWRQADYADAHSLVAGVVTRPERHPERRCDGCDSGEDVLGEGPVRLWCDEFDTTVRADHACNAWQPRP